MQNRLTGNFSKIIKYQMLIVHKIIDGANITVTERKQGTLYFTVLD